MAAVTNIADIKLRLFDGKAVVTPIFFAANGSLTTANASSGYFTASLNASSVGTTYPNTLVNIALPNTTDDLRPLSLEGSINATKSGWIGYYYLIGTADLTSTAGNRLTHSSTFTRLRRTRAGTANTPITMIPLVYLTAAASATTAAYTLDYVDQDGNSVTGTVQNQFPAAVTAVQSLYNLMLEPTDSAVLDITAINVATATTGATANIYGFEPIMPFNSSTTNCLSHSDSIYGSMNLVGLKPAVPDSGSVTSFLGMFCPSNLGSGVHAFILRGFNNT